MTQRTIIGLVGFPRSGKDAAADYLVKEHGFTRVAFGDGVKSLLLATDKSYKDSLEALEASKNNPEHNTRQKLQVLGEVLRNYDMDFWVKTAMEKIKGLPEDAKIVITDIRYQNEFHLVKDMGGEVIGIKRPGFGPVNNHVSEQNTTVILEHADRTVTNDDTVPTLARCILGDYTVRG